ncbi:DUF533 domain-containing protein [Thiolinea disciformis]|uniref:DUF533 domain-containing protein n=1 Tax=Thiolinea disciformis TaxID=125614 RepID=UPI0003621036|nr:DUF533 domain-containing protein [Thiolinea disciformis]
MSLASTLGRVAMGIIVGQATKKLLGGRGGAVGGLLGAVLGGGATRNAAIAGGIGTLLMNMLSSKSAQANTGASATTGGGVLGSLFNMLGSSNSVSSSGNKGVGDFLKASLTNEPIQATPEDEKTAALILRAMLNAVKSDGVIDDNEQAKIKEYLKDASPEAINFVKSELSKPMDLQGLIQSVPKGMEKQVYLMSLLSVTLDTPQEVQYMKNLAQGLSLSNTELNAMHDQLGIAHLA